MSIITPVSRWFFFFLNKNIFASVARSLSVEAFSWRFTHRICIFSPTSRHICVNLAVEFISQSDLPHVSLSEEGERRWQPLPRIWTISALTKQSIRARITFDLPGGVSSDCAAASCLFWSLLLTGWLLGACCTAHASRQFNALPDVITGWYSSKTAFRLFQPPPLIVFYAAGASFCQTGGLY